MKVRRLQKHGDEVFVCGDTFHPDLVTTGRAFDTSRLANYATSNIISSIVYGSRFDYDDPRFINMVNRVNEIIRLAGSAPIQVKLAHIQCLVLSMTCRKKGFHFVLILVIILRSICTLDHSNSDILMVPLC